jgi:hypothetical protein
MKTRKRESARKACFQFFEFGFELANAGFGTRGLVAFEGFSEAALFCGVAFVFASTVCFKLLG